MANGGRAKKRTAGKAPSPGPGAAYPTPSAHPGSSSDDSVSLRAAEFLANTLEQRRNQLVAKSTVLIAASTAVVVGILQFLFGGEAGAAGEVVIYILGGLALALACASIVSGLHLIRRLSKKEAGKRVARRLLYYGWVCEQDQAEFESLLRGISETEYLTDLCQQAYSLSHNLKGRYEALRWTYITLVVGLCVFVMALLVQHYPFGGTTKSSPSASVSASGGVTGSRPSSSSPAPSVVSSQTSGGRHP